MYPGRGGAGLDADRLPEAELFPAASVETARLALVSDPTPPGRLPRLDDLAHVSHQLEDAFLEFGREGNVLLPASCQYDDPVRRSHSILVVNQQALGSHLI